MNRKKALTLALVVGLLLAGALPAVSQDPTHGGPPDERPMSLACIPDMTAEQLEAIQDMREEHRAEIEGIQEKLFEAQKLLKELVREPEPDLNAVLRAKEALDELATEAMLFRLEMRRDIRGMLTEEQRVFFDEIQQCGPPMHDMNPGGDGPGMGPGSCGMMKP